LDHRIQHLLVGHADGCVDRTASFDLVGRTKDGKVIAVKAKAPARKRTRRGT